MAFFPKNIAYYMPSEQAKSPELVWCGENCYLMLWHEIEMVKSGKTTASETKKFIADADTVLKALCSHDPTGTSAKIKQAVSQMVILLELYPRAHFLCDPDCRVCGASECHTHCRVCGASECHTHC